MAYLSVSLIVWLVTASVAVSSPLVKRKNENYEVTGSTAAELRKTMNQKRPVNDANESYDGLTEWSITWDYQAKYRGRVWMVSNRSVELEVKVVAPRWTNFQNAPPLLRKQWRIYLANLLRHENGHVKVALLAANAIDKYLSSHGGASSLEKLQTDIKKNTHTLLEHYQKIDRDYDKRTRHGASQGAIFPKGYPRE